MKKHEWKKIIEFYRLCHQCGEREIWPYGYAYELHNCRQCYRDESGVYGEISKYCDYFLKSIETANLGMEREFIRLSFIRRQYRIIRESKGIYEPVVKCKICSESKPLFEMRLFWGDSFSCYRCEYENKSTKKCIRCGRVKDIEFFGIYENDNLCNSCGDLHNYDYDLRQKKIKLRREQYDYNYTKSYVIYFFKERGIIDASPEEIELKIQHIISKRLNKQLKERIKNESNCDNV